MATRSSIGFAAAIGGLAGASPRTAGRSAAGAALVGAVGLGASEAAPLGWASEKVTGAGPLAVGTATGTGSTVLAYRSLSALFFRADRGARPRRIGNRMVRR